MTTLTSVAAVAAAETLASMTKASQLYSVAETSMTQNSNKISSLDEVLLQNGKDTRANGSPLQPMVSSDASKKSESKSTTEKDTSNGKSKSHDTNDCSMRDSFDSKTVEAGTTFSTINGIGSSSISGEKNEGNIELFYLM